MQPIQDVVASPLHAAPVFARGSRLSNSIRILLFVSGVLSLVGLFGPAAHNMDVRSIGIVGSAVVFPIAVALMARLFRLQRSGAIPSS